MSVRPPTLSQVRVSKLDKVPDGWFTRDQLEKAWNLSQSHTSLLIKQALASRKAEMRRFKILHPSRSGFATPHYKFRGKG